MNNDQLNIREFLAVGLASTTKKETKEDPARYSQRNVEIKVDEDSLSISATDGRIAVRRKFASNGAKSPVFHDFAIGSDMRVLSDKLSSVKLAKTSECTIGHHRRDDRDVDGLMIKETRARGKNVEQWIPEDMPGNSPAFPDLTIQEIPEDEIIVSRTVNLGLLRKLLSSIGPDDEQTIMISISGDEYRPIMVRSMPASGSKPDDRFTGFLAPMYRD